MTYEWSALLEMAENYRAAIKSLNSRPGKPASQIHSDQLDKNNRTLFGVRCHRR